MKRTATTVVVTAVLATPLLLTACTGSTSDKTGRAGTISPAEFAGGVDGFDGKIAIGVGNRPGDDLVTLPAANQVDVRCTGEGNNLTVDITAPNGWRAALVHGSQTVTVDNERLNYPAQDFAVSDRTIKAMNAARTKGDALPYGVSWDKPTLDDVEIQVKTETPSHWTVKSPYDEFAMYMHVTCDAD